MPNRDAIQRGGDAVAGWFVLPEDSDALPDVDDLQVMAAKYIDEGKAFGMVAGQLGTELDDTRAFLKLFPQVSIEQSDDVILHGHGCREFVRG